IEVSMGIDTHGVRGGKERRVFGVVRFVGLAIRFFAVSQMGHQLVVGIDDRDAAAQIGNVDVFLVLIEATGVANIALQSALVFQFQGENFQTIIVPVGDIH